MSLSTEQCIAVAEKVWGWQYYPYPNKEYRAHWFSDTELMYPDAEGMSDEAWIQKEVNSWQGFGKTVEAVSSMKDSKKLDKAVSEMRLKYVAYLLGSSFVDKETLWKSTHLAALEIVNDLD